MAGPSLQQFEIFLIVAQCGSFTNAARQLNLSKAAVSQAIRNLELSLQVPLFIRTTRSIVLTDEGQLLFAQCERLKYELDTARDLVTNFNKQPTGTLCISCTPYLTNLYLIKPLQIYMQKFPKVNIDLRIEERMPDMQQEQVDIVLGVNWPAPNEVIARPIGKTRYVLCASPKYLKKYGTPKNLKELQLHRYIPHSGRTQDNLIVGLKKKIKIELNTPLIINNAAFMKSCALADLGIIQLHEYMVDEELKSGKLVEILADTLNDNISLFIYYHKYRFVQPKIRQFVNLVLL